MNRIRWTAVAAALLAAGLARAAAAQDQAAPAPNLAFEVHLGKTQSSGDWKNTATGRVNYGAAVRWSFLPFMAAYGGYDGYEYRINPALLADSVTGKIVDSGVRLGVDLHVPAAKRMPVQPFAEAGIVLNTAKHEFTRQGSQITDIFTSNFGVGYEAGGGVALQVLQRWSIVPEVRYHAVKPTFNDQNATPLPDQLISAWAFDLGVRFKP
jgi:opacity protein-like surface antigen